mmetsp:Transcript_126905/g.353377  ORF Transcript_126905/g.353377 Transcript_126905/m.353377 type:complete len:86 (-) Transcript_126905:112-369(-)
MGRRTWVPVGSLTCSGFWTIAARASKTRSPPPLMATATPPKGRLDPNEALGLCSSLSRGLGCAELVLQQFLALCLERAALDLALE